MVKRRKITEEEWNSFRKEKVQSFLKEKSLPELVRGLYKVRKPRDLTGEDSIEQRTFGDNFRGVKEGEYCPTYFDRRKGKETKTELAEFVESLKKLKENPTYENIVNCLEEAGDILWQYYTVLTLHRKNTKFWEVAEKFSTVCPKTISEVARTLKMPYEIVETAVIKTCEAKYGVRTFLEMNGYIGKYKKGEKEFIRYALECIYPFSDFLESQA